MSRTSAFTTRVEATVEVEGRVSIDHCCLNCGQVWRAKRWRRYAPGPFCSIDCRSEAADKLLPWTPIND